MIGASILPAELSLLASSTRRLFAAEVGTVALELEGLAQDAQGAVVGVQGAIDDGGDDALGVVLAEGLFDDGLAGFRLADDDAQAPPAGSGRARCRAPAVGVAAAPDSRARRGPGGGRSERGSRLHLASRFLRGLSVIGNEVDGASLAHALALEVHDGAVEFQAIEADLDFAISEVAGCLEAGVLKGEGVVGEDGAVLLDEEQLVVDLAWRQEADAIEIEAEAVDGLHAEGAVLMLMILILEPRSEGAIERFAAGQVEVARQEAHSNGTKESFDLPLRSPVALPVSWHT